MGYFFNGTVLNIGTISTVLGFMYITFYFYSINIHLQEIPTLLLLSVLQEFHFLWKKL